MASDESTEADAIGEDSSAESTVFDVTADYEQSTLDYYQNQFDIWVVEPFKILWSDYRGRFGIIVVAFYILMGTLGPVIVPAPEPNQAGRLIQPFENPSHILGTDGLGQDLFGLMVHATPAMLKMILSGAIAGSVTGVILGIIAGYKGGWTDKVIMTWGDTIASIPGIPLLILLAAIIEPENPFVIGIILNITGIAGASRGIRAQVLPLAEKEHVEAARAQGQSFSGLIVKEFLPHLLPLIFIGMLGGAVAVITASVALYFLGILPFTTQNWGVVLNIAYQESGAMYNPRARHWLLVPLVTLTLLNIALTMLAQAFDQVFNPRVRARHRGRKVEAEETDEEEATNVDSELIGGQMQQ
jgi:peptide/nickel transport system permease protein